MVKKSRKLKKNQKGHRAFWLTVVTLAVFIFALNVFSWCLEGFSDWYTDNVFPLWYNSYARLTGLFKFSVGELMLALAVALVCALVLLTIILIFLRRRKGFRRFFGGFLRIFISIAAAACLIMTLNCTIPYHCEELDANPNEPSGLYSENELKVLYTHVVERCNYYAEVVERDDAGVPVYVEEGIAESSTLDASAFSIDLLSGGGIDISGVAFTSADLSSGDESETADASLVSFGVDNISPDGNESTSAQKSVSREIEDESAQKSAMQETAKAALNALSDTYPRLAGYYPDVKDMFFSDLMCQMDMRGYYFPFSLEANVNAYMYIIQYPSTYCHELAHLHGYMYEDEANFIAFLACKDSGDDFFAYSGYLSVYAYVYNACMAHVTDAAERAALPVISDQVRADNIFITDEVRADVEERSVLDSETVDEVSDTLSDTSMKLNGVSDGILSYSRVVNLLLEYYDGVLY